MTFAQLHPPVQTVRRGPVRIGWPLATLAAAALGLAPAWGRAYEVHLDAAEAVRLALAASHTVAAASAQQQAARSGRDAAEAAARPRVTSTATVAERSAVPEFGARLGGPTEPPVVIFPDIRTAWDMSLEVRQPLYTGGALAASREASRHDLDSAASTQRAIGADVALAAAVAYWQAVAARASLRNAEQQELRVRRLNEDTSNLRAVGMAVDADVLAAQARLASARLAVVRAQAACAEAHAALVSMLALPADTQLVLSDPLDAALPSPPAPVDQLLGHARSARTDLAAARARADALGARARVAAAAARPTVGASIAWDYSRPNQRYLPLKDEWKDSWSIGLAATWTLWDGGKVRADVAAARARQQAAEEELAELQRRIDLEVEVSRQGLASALESVAAADVARTAAAAREAAVTERMSQGLASVSDELDAQSDLAQAENEGVATRAAVWIAAARLERAVGR